MSDHNTIFQPVNDFVQSIIYTRMENFRYRNRIPNLCDDYISDMKSIIEYKNGCSAEAKDFIQILEVIKEEYFLSMDIMIDNIKLRLQ